MLTNRPRGTEDILPEEVGRWYLLEATARKVSRLYGYREIRTPVFEHTELFNRGVGDNTDIVEKEMYTFTDRGGRSVTLRPEGTAPVVRAFLEHHLEAGGLPVKLFYLGPMFRYGRPQAGRLRQFHQFGVEAFGSRDPALDAEVIALAMDFYNRLALKDLELHLNSVGCPACRPRHREKLQDYLRPRLQELCPTCQGRFERNPLRIFDCKSPVCQEIVAGAPTIAASLCPDCGEHFERVQEYLQELGIDFILDEHLVRGLDYYTNTAFEIMVKGIGAQSSIGGGGRYDGLVEALGGKPVPGIGFGLGLERVLLALEAQGRDLRPDGGIDVLAVTAGAGVERAAVRLLANLRKAGLKADKDYLGRSLKAQMKYANRYPAKLAVILGEEELSRGQVLVRRLDTGTQEEVPLEAAVEYCRRVKGTCGG
ncbi:Histidine-tRNA ligase/ATP phosphoribosyltransferase regulatory subunit [Moorella glycerini]|uniref:Histidine--tRNA ligase n=1 Tax=Neomoorella stamsii TaxID=1266720 RepID=A0A9X7P6U7_9FIRM|nr:MULTISPECIES: histidine--tRNA ligase [Moorella]PRR75295.1 Histidine--tRNA ligase [Moorella stamsii]CEP67262.1 Histidine-tRNA ligase/ATP phosphoribosyltransferase regulatory subunit [Moorella glycerini]